ncbi:MAG: hypothetical protein KDA75_15205 [Planctomycetaceae bacterium]|nr:hypothetical protein [Planctomycetaceae bacterium]
MAQRSLRRRLAAAIALVALTGCAGSRGDMDLVEARLRDQQDLVARYEQLVDSSQQELVLARQETNLLRTQLANAGQSPLLPEHADVLLRAEKLAFHQMMTGARDVDGHPGDDALNVVLTPQSNQGETVRLIGELDLEALDLSRPEGQQRIGQWKFTTAQAAELWHAGFLASGFQMDLPWESRPRSSDVLLHARLTTPDGRQLDASHSIHVDLPVVQTAMTADAAPRIEPGPLPFENAMAPDRAPEPADLTATPESSATTESGTVEDVPSLAANPFEVSDEPSPPPLAPGLVEAEATPPEGLPFPEPTAAPEIADSTHPAEPPEFPAGSGPAVLDTQVEPTAEATLSALPVQDAAREREFVDAATASTDGGPSITGIPDDAARQPVLASGAASRDFPAIVPQPRSVPPTTEDASLAITPGGATVERISDPSVRIAPLDLPRRYRRNSETLPTVSTLQPEPVPYPQSTLRPLTPVESRVPDPTETPAPASHPAADDSPGTIVPAPFPVDMTPPDQSPAIIRSSVNWTDESIPYLR